MDLETSKHCEPNFNDLLVIDLSQEQSQQTIDTLQITVKRSASSHEGLQVQLMSSPRSITNLNKLIPQEKKTIRQPREEEQKDIQTQFVSVKQEFDPALNYQQYLLGNLKIREGFLHVKEKWGYQKVFVVLAREKLFEYPNEKKEYPLRVVCFRNYRCELSIQDNLFTLRFRDLNKVIQYRIQAGIEMKEWSKGFLSVVSLSTPTRILPCEVDRYFNEDIISEREFLSIAESGDLLLFETDNLGAKIQRVVTSSKYDHVAIVLRISSQYVSIFDSNADTGVSFVEWNTFIDINDLYQKVVLRKLCNVNRKAIEYGMYSFLNTVHGKKYQVTTKKLLRQNSLSPSDSRDTEEGYFCSELVAKALKRCNLLNTKKACSSYWPIDFAQEKNLKLAHGAYLEREVTVVLNKHCTKNQ